ncbi:triose-phosphate transporter family-domain-containing protein [Xylariales sp. PMI_506]|nr:triose-phosphate transporter family-domain-containing protein [Xylariales sp. PMI_506]
MVSNSGLPGLGNGWGKTPELHPAFYIASWIFFSNITIIFNKWLLDTAGFQYPIILTTIHLTVATVLTQVLARCTPLLNSRFSTKITGRIYLRAILPIGLMYTLSLLLSNLTYLHLSVPFIQMLKAFAPVSTLFLSFFLGLSNPKVSVLYNVLVIGFGVLLSSLGEVRFSWIGFGYQMGGTVAESIRLLMIQALLSEGEGGLKMNPLVGLYYYAPVCAVLNGAVAFFAEVPTFNWGDLERVGWSVLLLNGVIAFMLNVSSVFLIGRTSALAMNLTGILKSILLVAVSMLIWQTTITFLQTIGYGIALLGMCYYSLGPDGARSFIESCQTWINSRVGIPGTSFPLRRLRNPLSNYRAVPTQGEAHSDPERGTAEGGVMDQEPSQGGGKLGVKQG